jgi:folate-binding protein YgfZ
MDNLNRLGHLTRLPHLGLIRFAGPDAVAFLQGQLSNDTRRLLAGQGLLAAWSTPQGRVLAVLTLLPHSSGIIALLPADLLAPTLEGLRKYVLRSKVRIEDLSGEFAVLGGWGGTAASAGYSEVDDIGSAPVAGDAERRWIIGSRTALDRPGIAVGEAAASAWRLADIRSGLPQIYAVTRELFVAQMLNLDLIDGISFTKGCFTGQEIIARTQHLGRIKRRMFRLGLPPGAWSVGQAVRLDDGRTGRLLEVGPAGETGESQEALAVLTLDPVGGEPVGGIPDGEELERAALAAVTLPLPYAWPPALGSHDAPH